MAGKEAEKRELNDEQRGQENRDAARHETWLFLLCRHSLFPPLPPVFKVNKLAKPQYLPQREKEREVETERGMSETCRQTELLPSGVPDGPI